MARTRGEGASHPLSGIDLPAISLPSINVTVNASPPDTLSQRNVEAATGIPARTFLELMREPSFALPVIRLGKLRLVNRAAFLQWLSEQAIDPRKRHAAQPSPSPSATEEETSEDDVSPDSFLAELGLRVIPDPSPRHGSESVTRSGGSTRKGKASR